MTMRQVADRLGVAGSTVSRALHAARVPVRGNAVAHGDRSGRLLVDDLYADEQVRQALSRFDVHVPDEWTEAGPFTVYAPLPLPARLLWWLYTEIGLSAQHIALVCGVGVGAVKSRLAQLGSRGGRRTNRVRGTGGDGRAVDGSELRRPEHRVADPEGGQLVPRETRSRWCGSGRPLPVRVRTSTSRWARTAFRAAATSSWSTPGPGGRSLSTAPMPE
jgi:hypothetical protein